MSEDEYVREGFYQIDHPVKEDVLREQEKINRADIIVFIYPDFWTASPAMLEGWLQRVWTYGFAYGNDENREKRAILFSNRAYELAQNIESTLATRTPEAKVDGI